MIQVHSKYGKYAMRENKSVRKFISIRYVLGLLIFSSFILLYLYVDNSRYNIKSFFAF